jgi:hypothetical protein
LNPTNDANHQATDRAKRMTTKAAKKKRSRLQRDFIPNFEMRSLLVIATFAVSAASACAQTSARPPAMPGQSNPVTMTTAADRTENTKIVNQVSQVRTNSSTLDAAFNRADADRDGRLSRKEAEHFPMLSQRFDAIDSNRDSFISREEFNQAAGN